MRTFAIAALAASLVCFAPGIASAHVTGVLTLGYEYTDSNFDSCGGECSYNDETEQGPSISGAIAAPLMGDDGPWMIQGDGRLQSEEEDYGYGYTPHSNVGHAALHIAYRTDEYAVGAFYGLQNDHGNDVQEIGIEAQKYWSRFTLQGSAAYGKHSDSCSGCNDDYSAWDAQASLTYYVNDSWSVSGNVGYASWDYNYGSTDLTTVGVSAEYRIPETKYSVRAAYIHGDASDTFNDYQTDTFQVALVMDLGSGNARERDQHGASLPGADAFDTHWRLWE